MTDRATCIAASNNVLLLVMLLYYQYSNTVLVLSLSLSLPLLQAAEKKEEDANSKRMAVKTSSKIKSTDVTDDDWPVIKKIAEFSTQRRIPILTVDPSMALEEVVSKAQTEMKRGTPCIIRPKKGKSIMKLLQVLRQRHLVLFLHIDQGREGNQG